MDVDPAQRDRAMSTVEGVVQGHLPDSFISCQALGRERGYVMLDNSIGDVAEVTVLLVVGSVEIRQCEPCCLGAEPPSLHLGHVSQETDERHARGTDRGSLQLVVAQASALPQQRSAMEVQPTLVHLSLVGHAGGIVAESACVWSRHDLNLLTRPRCHATVL